MHEMPMVPPFDAPLHAQSNQQPNRDRGQMNKKIAPPVDRFVGRMHIEHGLRLLSWIPPSLSNSRRIAAIKRPSAFFPAKQNDGRANNLTVPLSQGKAKLIFLKKEE